MKIIYIAAVCFLIALSTACNKSSSNTYDCTGTNPTYTGKIASILNTHCALSGCHVGSSAEKGIRLESYSYAKSASSNSNFMGSIQHSSGYDAMPKGASQLPDSTIKLIYCWIQNGTPE